MAGSIPYDSAPIDINHPARIAALIVVGVLGSLAFPFLPMIVGAISDNLQLSQSEVGFIASADMVGMLAGSVFALIWIRKTDWRVATFFFAAGLITSHFLSILFQDFTMLFSIRVLAGLCGGSLMAISATGITDSARPDRNTALWTGLQMSIAAIGFLIFPGIVAIGGYNGLLLTMVALAAPIFVVLFWLPKTGTWSPEKLTASGERKAIGPQDYLTTILAALPLFLFHLAFAASWTYLERIGKNAGFDAQFIGNVLAISVMSSVLGSVVAFFLSTRIGRMVPFIGTVFGQVLALAILMFALSGPITFALPIMVLAFFFNFALPYQVGIAAEIDRTGRVGVIYLMMLKIGIGIAPAFVGLLVMPGNFLPALLVSAVAYVLCFVNLLVLNIRHGARSIQTK